MLVLSADTSARIMFGRVGRTTSMISQQDSEQRLANNNGVNTPAGSGHLCSASTITTIPHFKPGYICPAPMHHRRQNTPVVFHYSLAGAAFGRFV